MERKPKKMKSNGFSFQKLFDNNTLVLIISIILGVIVWFFIYGSQTPNYNTIISDVPVTVSYENSMAQDLGLEIIGEPVFYVDITVNGKKSKITKLTASDFSASVSLNTVSKAGTYTLPVQVLQNVSDPDYSVVSWNLTEVSLRFDQMVSKSFPLEVSAPYLTAEDGYLMETAYSDLDTVTVRGPQSDIEKIKRCVVVLEDDGTLTDTLITTGRVQYLDESGAAIESEYFQTEYKEATVTVPVYKTKLLPIEVEFINIPKGFPISSLNYTMTRTSILVAAPGDTVDNIESVSLGPIDFRTIDIGSEFVLDVVLNAGLKNVEQVTEVTVTFPTYGLTTETFSVSNFILENLPSGYQASVLTSSLTNVKIVGENSVMRDLESEDLVAAVDLSQIGIGKGRYNVTVKVYVQNRVLAWAVGEYKVDIQITENEE